MNKIFKVASVAIIALVANTAFAQTNTTNLHVNVEAVYSIVVTDADVTIDMNEPEHFVNGNASDEQTGHLEVTATDGYEVTVTADEFLVGESEAEEISTGTIVVTANDGVYLGNGTDGGSTADFQEAQLATGGNVLITGSAGDLRSFDVTYTIPAASAPAYINVPVDVYTTLVTYTIAAD
jgi:hypothetical protein